MIRSNLSTRPFYNNRLVRLWLLLGLVLVSAFAYCIPRLGVATTITLVIVAQLVVGGLLDHFGVLVAEARPLDVSRLVGVVVLLGGTWLVVR